MQKKTVVQALYSYSPALEWNVEAFKNIEE